MSRLHSKAIAALKLILLVTFVLLVVAIAWRQFTIEVDLSALRARVRSLDFDVEQLKRDIRGTDGR